MSASVQILVSVPKIDAGLASAALFLCPYWDKADLAMLQVDSKMSAQFQKQSMPLPTKQLLHNGAQAAERALPC